MTILVSSSTNNGTPSVLLTTCSRIWEVIIVPLVKRSTISFACADVRRVSVIWLMCERGGQGAVNSGRGVFPPEPEFLPQEVNERIQGAVGKMGETLAGHQYATVARQPDRQRVQQARLADTGLAAYELNLAIALLHA